jgi:restriction system protein
MGRKKQSFFEDLVEVSAMFPWWVGIILAVAAYALLHPVAAMEIAAAPKPADIGMSVSKAIFRAAATVGQYVLPAAFLIGSAISVFSRRRLDTLHSRAATTGTTAGLGAMSWQEFERLVGEHFRWHGFSVTVLSRGGADGGVDIVLSRGRDRYLVQCKQWKARRVGVEIIRELYGVMAAERAAGGYVVTSGVFSEEAKRFAEGTEIELIDGDELVKMIKCQADHRPVTSPKRVSNSSVSLDPESSSGITGLKNEVPSCPECNSPMVLRAARKGSNAGNSFWGCSTFPKTKCRGTRPAST